MINLTLAQIAKMCDGRLITQYDSGTQGNDSTSVDADNILVNQVVIDSRQVTVPQCNDDSHNSSQNNSGTLFVAIIGETQDGHKFVNQSIANGAVACLVSHLHESTNFSSSTGSLNANSSTIATHSNFIVVSDTTKALGLLAANYRKLFNIPVVAITGSNGKTTVKEMLRSICNIEFGADHVLATEGNLNNHWGLPLTLLRLDNQHKVAILEMGMNHAGELDYLSNMAKPTIAIVNNAMRAHVEFFKNVEDVAKAKGEIYHGLMVNGIACINISDPLCDIWKAAADRKNIFAYRTVDNKANKHDVKHDSQCYLKDVSPDGTLTIVALDSEFSVKLQVLGGHNQANAIAVTALAINIGCGIDSIRQGLESFTGYKRRLERKMAFNGGLIIDDSYNANPDSVKAAILAIQTLPQPYWFIFGDLGELGAMAETWHREIGEFARDNNISTLLTIGELAKIGGDSFTAQFIQKNIENIVSIEKKQHGHNVNNLQHLHFADNQAIIDYCREHLPNKVTLLIKGSRSMKLDTIVDALV
jgi:UDP-N-acetylmuramoyl-tripeptide--D-alanyl-D-alanine ligase